MREDIANSWCEIEQARLLTLRAAEKMDREGNKSARDMIAAAKVVVPRMAARVIDRAIQIHGAAGVSQDTFLAEAYMYARFMRLGDGPDQVHLAQLGRGIAEALWDGGVSAGGAPTINTSSPLREKVARRARRHHASLAQDIVSPQTDPSRRRECCASRRTLSHIGATGRTLTPFPCFLSSSLAIWLR